MLGLLGTPPIDTRAGHTEGSVHNQTASLSTRHFRSLTSAKGFFFLCTVPGVTLHAANSTPVSSYSQRSCTLDLNLRRNFRWNFVIAAVQQPILGVDFLEHINLVADLRNRCLVYGSMSLEVTSQPRRTFSSPLSALLFLYLLSSHSFAGLSFHSQALLFSYSCQA